MRRKEYTKELVIVNLKYKEYHAHNKYLQKSFQKCLLFMFHYSANG